MLKIISQTGWNSLIWQAPFSSPILILLTDNKWFHPPPWDWYLIILVTLLFSKFGILKYSQFRWYLFWNVLESPYLILQSFNFITFRRCLPKKLQRFYPLTGISMCKERTLAMVYLLFVMYRSCKCRN